MTTFAAMVHPHDAFGSTPIDAESDGRGSEKTDAARIFVRAAPQS